jgi:hypothetical protein
MGGAPAFAQTQPASDQTQPPSAQTEDVQQLKDKVQQLEGLTDELKARLAELEKSNSGQAQVVNANIVKPNGTGDAAPSQPPSPPAAPTPSQTTQTTVTGAPVTQVIVTAQLPTERSEEKDKEHPRYELYGFVMLDMGYDFGQNDPNWFDVMRPTKLPAFTNEFGRDGTFYTGVRQTRVGIKAYFPTPLGELKTIWEWELFGVGVDAGQTTFRLRHAWGELKHVGAGQTWSPFMDPDVFPNSLEYWGPSGMVFFRNVQLRYMPINDGNHQVWIAVERPGASGDQGTLAGREELSGIQARFPAPDLSARVRWGGERDYLQIAGIGRYINWDDLHSTATLNLGGHVWGWGVNASANIPGVGKKDVIKAQVVYGHGIENYMNDAPVDLAPVANPGNARTPITGAALPVLGVVGFYDRYWGERFSTAVGYSLVKIDNVALQVPSEFHKGQYGLINLLYYPTKNAMMGAEFQWGQRNNFKDGFSFDDYRIQLGFRYNFDYKWGAK